MPSESQLTRVLAPAGLAQDGASFERWQPNSPAPSVGPALNSVLSPDWNQPAGTSSHEKDRKTALDCDSEMKNLKQMASQPPISSRL